MIKGGNSLSFLMVGTGLFFAAILTGCGADSRLLVSREVSYGFRSGESLYFLADYSRKKRGRRFWFILPFEGSITVLHRDISLFRYDIPENRLTRLALLRRDFPLPAANVKHSLFRQSGDRLLIAYIMGQETKERFAFRYDLIDYDLTKGRMEMATVFEDDPRYRKFFGDYESPFTANPGIVGISELNRDYLKGITEEQCGQP